MSRLRNFFLILILVPQLSWGRQPDEKAESKIKVDQLVSACERADRKDQVCEGLLQLKQIGDDAIEALKKAMKLGTFEYAVLTAGNFAVTGRLRVSGRSAFRNWDQTLDYHRSGEWMFYLERSL